MQKWVSASEKRNFLKWFIQNHQLKNYEARKIIELIISKQGILENLTFTEEIKVGKKTIIVSSVNSDSRGFQYLNGHSKTDSVAVAYGEILSNPSLKLNIILNFYGKQLNNRYLQLIETSGMDKMKTYEKLQKSEQKVDIFLEKILLEKQINDALDSRDEVLFKRLVERMKELQKLT